MDATVAVSETGVNVVLQKALVLAKGVKSDANTWGPFQVSYAVSIALSGGSATLENAPANKLHLNNVSVNGTVFAQFKFDLGLILPKICIPPVRACLRIPGVGRVCTPQFCVPWPKVTVGIALPIAFKFSASFGFRVDDLGTQWGIVLLVDPFSTSFDFSPMGPAIINAIKNKVTSELSSIPLIGGLIADLVNTVIGAFTPVLSALFGALSALVNLVLAALDLLNVNIPFTLLKFDKQQTFVPGNTPLLGDAPVKMDLAVLQARVLDRELVAEGQLA